MSWDPDSPDWRKWYVVRTPVVTITGIDKERRTQGRVVLLSCEERSSVASQHKTYGFLSQSLPTLVRWMNEGRAGRKFMVSGFYRIMRNQQHTHHKWIARCFDRSEAGIEALNEALSQFSSLLFVVNTPEAWRVILPEESERPPQPESEPGPAKTALVDETSVAA